MLILFSSLAAHGHTYPLLPLAIAAGRDGHDIVYATGEAFHPLLESLGFEAVAAGAEGERVVNGDERIRMALKAFGPVLPIRFLVDLAPVLAGRRPDLVVYEAANLGAGVAAKLAGIPAVCHGFGRGTVPRADDRLVAPFVRFAAQFGVDIGGVALGDPCLDIYPDSLQDLDYLASARRFALRPVAFSEAGELPQWLGGPGPPVVYLTLGTAFGDAGVLRAAIDGLAGMDARVLVAAGPTVDVAELGGVPGNVTVRSWLPQADLLPHADLVVHHGGSGTTLGALAAGVPQLFLPRGADQFINAEHVTAARAGEQLLADAATTANVRATATALLSSPGARAAARRIADEIAAMPSPADIARRLPDFAH